MKKIIAAICLALFSASSFANVISENHEEIKSILFKGRCVSLNYRNTVVFKGELNALLNTKDTIGLPICAKVTFDNEYGIVYNIDNLPEAVQVYIKTIKSTGGDLNYIKVSRGIYDSLIKFLIRVVGGAMFPNYEKVSKDYDAEIFYADNITNPTLKDIQTIKFVPRN